MIRVFTSVLIAGAIALACPALVRGQENDPATDKNDPVEKKDLAFPVAAEAVAPAASRRTMYEDIEILRRVLDRKLEALYPAHTQVVPNLNYCPPGGYGTGGNNFGMMGSGGMMGNRGGMGMTPNWFAYPQTVTQERPCSVEGVYLKGQGVIFTVTVPSLEPQTKKAAAVALPQSDWEMARRQLRKEPEPPRKTEAAKKESLTDLLLKVLAENGHHFSQLTEDERLTVVVTVRGAGQTGAPEKVAKPQPAKTAGAKVRDLELVGDLHLKQGRYAEAIADFTKALELKPDNKHAAELHRKLAQAHLAMEKTEQARAELDLAIALASKQSEPIPAPGAPDRPAATSIPLPVKLIVSAPKKLLDEAGKGKMSVEDFAKKASVEELRFADTVKAK